MGDRETSHPSTRYHSGTIDLAALRKVLKAIVTEGIHRRQVEKHEVEGPGCYLAVTMSLGVAAAGSHTLEGRMLVHEADEALYRAKELGRNQVVQFCRKTLQKKVQWLRGHGPRRVWPPTAGVWLHFRTLNLG
jgi:hypothetical protein